jgi:hypothetical protein
MAGVYRSDARSRRPPIDAARLWAGGGATAMVAALITIVGALIARNLLDVTLLAPKGNGVWGEADVAWYAVIAGILGLAATGLIHALVLFTPHPMRFFGWVVALLTVIGTVAPFVANDSAVARLTTAALNLVLGIAIGSLVAGSARGAIRAARIAQFDDR